MDRPTRFALVLVGLLAVSAFVGVSSASSLTTIDDDHGLVDPATIDEYDESGVATADVGTPQMTLTVAESSSDVGVSGLLRFDMATQYLRIQYNETLDREVRVFIPAEYWHPVSAELEAENPESDTTATMRPTDDGRYTAVTVAFDGREDAVFALPKQTEFVFWSRDRSREVINETVGYQPPRLATGGEWEYIDPSELTANETVPIEADGGVTIQQDDSDPATDESNWIGVPQCSRSSDAVCTYEVDGNPNTEYLLTQSSDPPAVRYKTGTDPTERGWAIIRDLESIPDRVWSDFAGILGG
jgi:hypothetical protein